jgi:hypothetical protein
LDADKHVIEITALGESLKGIGRIIAVTANFAATEKFTPHQDARSIRVVAKPPEVHCFEVTAVLEWVNQNSLATTVVGGLTVTLVSYIFSKLAGNKAEMKELRTALETAIKELGNREQQVVDRLLDTVDKMAESLRPSAKQALAPIGKTAATLSVRSASDAGRSKLIGLADKEAIESREPTEIDLERQYNVVIHEMNLDTATCRVSLADDPEGRIAAIITDPVAILSNNVYATAFASQTEIAVKAKAASRDGKVEKLYISDTA